MQQYPAPVWRRDIVIVMPSENELTAALMRLCDDPDARARLHIQAAANHGRMVMLDAAYDASGLTATFTEQTSRRSCLRC